jgi:hypothetical protein
MMEMLLSLVLLVAALALAIWPFAVIGLFLTVTGSMLTLLFLFKFVRQLRFQGAKEVTGIPHAWQRWRHVVPAMFSTGGTDMRTIPPRVSIPLVMGTVLLLILAFPGKLYANDLSATHHNPVAGHNHALTVVLPDWTPSGVATRDRLSRDHVPLLMDADFRLRATAALVGNPAIEKPAENAHVPLRMIVLTASPLLEV